MTNDNEGEKKEKYSKINHSQEINNKDFRYQVDRGMEKNVTYSLF